MTATARNESDRPPPHSERGSSARLMGIRWAIAASVGAGVLLVMVLVLAAWWAAGWPSLRRDGQVGAGTVFELFKLVFAVVAGVGAVVALVVAYRRQHVAEAADVRADAAEVRADTALFNERYSAAAAQLGAEQAAVRLAGVYALAGLADDWVHGRQTCIDVLCAYLRMPYTPPAPDDPDHDTDGDVAPGRADRVAVRQRARAEQEVRHTIIGIIRTRLREGASVSWQGRDFDFTGAIFDGGDLDGAVFSAGTVDFRGAVFSGRVVLRGATFSGGDVSFARTIFTGGRVSFRGASFAGGRVSFRGANFSGGEVSFGGAAFSGGEVSFAGATLSAGRVSFGGAAFSGGEVSFRHARFSGSVVYFGVAAFSGGRVSFTAATFSGGEVSFGGATFSGGMVDLGSARHLDGPPPRFDHWPSIPPDGLLLPKSLRSAGTGS